MATIFDSQPECECFDCIRDAPFHPNYCSILQKILPADPIGILQKILPADPIGRCQFMQKLYYLKPLKASSQTKDWKSVTHRDFVFRDDLWSIDFPKPSLDLRPGFSEYTCRKWCKEIHNEPLPGDAYEAKTMPNLFEEPRRPIYSDLRQCCSTYEHDYTWKNDYRTQGKFPGWCLRGNPPEYLYEDRN